MISRAFELGLLPGPDRDGRWSEAAAAELRSRWAQIVTAIMQAEELGGVRCAQLLSRVTGLPVTSADIKTLHVPFRAGVAIEDYPLEPVSRAVGAQGQPAAGRRRWSWQDHRGRAGRQRGAAAPPRPAGS